MHSSPPERLTLRVAAPVQLAVLIAREAARPRLRYDTERWGTVFPLGMYAAASFLTGEVEGIAAVRELAGVLVWIALASFGLAALGLARRARWAISPA